MGCCINYVYNLSLPLSQELRNVSCLERKKLLRLREEASIIVLYFICCIRDCFLPVSAALFMFEKSYHKYSEQI